ncbi:MAG: ABC transporter permease [Clostridia bacterium]|nr:ABC transporter permease [Clostridia bacterium]
MREPWSQARTRALLRWLSPVLVLALWQAWGSLVHLGWLPLPSDVARAAVERIADGTLLKDAAISLRRVLIGFAAGVGTAVPLGVWIATSRVAEAIVDPLVELVRPIPPLGWIPFAMLTFGLEETPKEFIIWLGVFFPVLLNTAAGVRSVDPTALKAARSLGANRRQIFMKVVLPASLPSILTGMRVGLGVGWTCLVAAELIAAKTGLGYLIMRSYHFVQYDDMVLGMAAIGALGALLEHLLRVLDQRLTFWVERA